MKVGDLVTLSSYGKRINYMGKCIAQRKYNGGFRGPLIGLVIAKVEPTHSWEKQMKYSVAWIDNCEFNPQGRDNWVKYIHRKDLKMVKKAKEVRR